ncbi:MAG: hypothetical protein M3005_04325 [Apilactobacillus sp.]|uniref:hypothetical protein n=1 Tax=Apilactobacillus sp. TaxID=2767901 RepID=UPI0025E526F9|nr:hypothetical protein [Apilactobacillus sp.]MCT6823084.1 hypothetical protein [Apilactobacillus sp.]
MQKIKQRLTPQNIFMLVISFVCMFFLTTASPFYEFNRSLDANTMYTVGKGLLHGLMPYKDLFDNRGPLIYLIHSVNAVFSYRSFTFIYIIESLLLFLDIAYINRILSFKLSRRTAMLCSFLFIPLAFSSRIFFYGDLPEEYAMTFVFILIYSCIKYNWFDMPRRYYIVNGAFVAILFWIKYSLIIPWVIFFVFVGIACLITKRYKQLFIIILDALIGFLVVTIPIMILYLATGALKAMFYAYFYLNLTHYHVQDATLSYTLFKVMYPTFGFHHHLILIRTVYYIMIGLFIYAVVRYMESVEVHGGNKALLSLIVFLDIVLTYEAGGASFSYYLFACEPFIIFYLFVLGLLIDRYIADKKYLIWTLSGLALLGIFVTNHNYRSSMLVAKPHQMYEVEFTKKVNASKDKSILNYHALDLGMFTYTGTYSKDRFFIRNNLQYAPMAQYQRKYLHSLKYKFVVTKYYPDELLPKQDRKFLKQHYKLVAKNWYNYSSHRQGLVALYERK